MAKTLLARGQATIHTLTDGYTFTLSPAEYVFPADASGKILTSVSVTSTLKIVQGEHDYTVSIR